MRKLIAAVSALAIMATTAVPAFAADFVAASSISLIPAQARGFVRYTAAPPPTESFDSAGTLFFETGENTLSEFGGATSYDEPVTPDPLTQNTRRNKDAALLPPPYGVFSGDIPTDLSSPYHDNSPSAGAPNIVALPETPDANGFLPSTSTMLNATLNTAPLYYKDGSIGKLYVLEPIRPSRSTRARASTISSSARGISRPPPLGTAMWLCADTIAARTRFSAS
jgi:hypothetical protein